MLVYKPLLLIAAVLSAFESLKKISYLLRMKSKLSSLKEVSTLGENQKIVLFCIFTVEDKNTY